MASLASIGRLSGRIGRRRLARAASTPRGFRTCAAMLAAQNFTMPALSPTMTEGNIAAWRVKEGDKFSAGDVLLEIETDKATMDVEAQDEGILVKIMQGDGAKGVKVGDRIAVLAEEGDDVSSLDIPPEEPASGAKQQQHPTTESKPDGSSAYGASSQPPQQSEAPPQPVEATKKATGGEMPKLIYPLLPSVAQIVKEKGIDETTLAQITPTGPNGRLLKGDILAHLGAINQNTPVAISDMFERLSHLDLSNIKLAKPAAAPQKAAASATAEAPSASAKAPRPATLEVTLPVSFAPAFEAREKLKNSLGIELPLSQYVERASLVANDALPVPADYQPTANELFDQVLGLSRDGPRTSRGSYQPQILGFSSVPEKPVSRRQPDIIDVLAGTARKAKKPVRPAPASSGDPIFISLTVPKTEEKRAKTFLQRFKLVIEEEPESLVLIK